MIIAPPITPGEDRFESASAAARAQAWVRPPDAVIRARNHARATRAAPVSKADRCRAGIVALKEFNKTRGSLGYIAGQYPVAVYLGPYLPDVTGAIVVALGKITSGLFGTPDAWVEQVRRVAERAGAAPDWEGLAPVVAPDFVAEDHRLLARRASIVITSLPYQVSPGKVIEQIAAQMRAKAKVMGQVVFAAEDARQHEHESRERRDAADAFVVGGHEIRARGRCNLRAPRRHARHHGLRSSSGEVILRSPGRPHPRSSGADRVPARRLVGRLPFRHMFMSLEHPQDTGKKAVPPFASQIIREFSGLVPDWVTGRLGESSSSPHPVAQSPRPPVSQSLYPWSCSRKT